MADKKYICITECDNGAPCIATMAERLQREEERQDYCPCGCEDKWKEYEIKTTEELLLEALISIDFCSSICKNDCFSDGYPDLSKDYNNGRCSDFELDVTKLKQEYDL